MELQDDQQSMPVRQTSIAHQFVTCQNTNNNAIRTNIEQSAINFPMQCMNTEDDGTIKSLMSILNAVSTKDFILARRSRFHQFYPSDFANYVFKSWNNLAKIENVEVEDTRTTSPCSLLLENGPGKHWFV